MNTSRAQREPWQLHRHAHTHARADAKRARAVQMYVDSFTPNPTKPTIRFVAYWQRFVAWLKGAL